ncbi:16S rRNA (guanine(527)-N(7))-methyltransferase RsmG [Bdellovibrio sp. HCB337]|uniref:16S rRNA (guanine(527)-N(7))-methyltransferase RsmG n=1 Tax=Bdellovibrio sp. HCB337 TaxID=3394358 RepID=UPI0039A44AB7
MAHKNKTNYSPYKARQEARNKALGAKAPVEAPKALHGKHKKPESIYSINEANDRLADIFRNHGFQCSHEERMKLAHFYRLLMENQEKENFTRLLKLRDIAIKHYIDCMIVADLVDLKFPLMDVGTGPGFPGIPLKIRYPNKKIILAEGVQRRVEFLKHVREEMNLQELDIVGRNINKHFVYPVNGVITRAVEDIRNTLGNVLNCLQLGGCVYFMKGPGVDPEIPMALKEYGQYYQLKKDIPYSLPETPHQRRLVIFEKIKHAPLPEEDEGEELLMDELSGEEKRRWSTFGVTAPKQGGVL